MGRWSYGEGAEMGGCHAKLQEVKREGMEFDTFAAGEKAMEEMIEMQLDA